MRVTGSEVVDHDPETHEQWSERLRSEGKMLYDELRAGRAVRVRSVAGGYYNDEEFRVSRLEEFYVLAIKHFQIPEEEVREDHIFYGEDQEVAAKLEPREMLREFLQGVGESARENGDPRTMRAIRNIVKWSQDPEVGVPEVPGLRISRAQRPESQETPPVIVVQIERSINGDVFQGILQEPRKPDC